MSIEVVQGDPMEAEAVEGDPTEADDGRSNTDLFGHSGDIDSDSDSKWKSWRKSLFWYEIPELRDIPDYDVLRYPWEEEEEEWKGKYEDGEEGRDKEEEGVLFLKVTDTTWSDLSDEQRKRGRWEEHPTMVSSRITSAAASSSGLEGVADAQQQSLCTSAEVLNVRMEMHECYEKGASYRRLFESKAKQG
jgi:hypothetical protein